MSGTAQLQRSSSDPNDVPRARVCWVRGAELLGARSGTTVGVLGVSPFTSYSGVKQQVWRNSCCGTGQYMGQFWDKSGARCRTECRCI